MIRAAAGRDILENNGSRSWIRYFAPRRKPSAAMVPSLLVGDHVMVKKKVDDVRLGGSAFAVHGRGVGDE